MLALSPVRLVLGERSTRVQVPAVGAVRLYHQEVPVRFSSLSFPLVCLTSFAYRVGAAVPLREKRSMEDISLHDVPPFVDLRDRFAMDHPWALVDPHLVLVVPTVRDAPDLAATRR